MGFRGRRATVAVGLGAAVLAAGTVDSPAAAAATRTTVYKGTATMTVGVYDYCGWGGEPRYLGTATYKLAAKLTVSPTQKSGRQSEGNPFHFSFAAGTPRTNGSLFLASSETFRVSSPPLLLRYWKYTRSAKTGAFSGSLISTHKAEGAVANSFNASTLLVPCRPSLGTMPVWPQVINTGARISGRITSAHAQATVTGSASSSSYVFVFRMVFKK